MKFEIKTFDLIGINGFSEQLLNNHFTLYQGYVTNTNKLIDALSTLIKENKASTPEFAELKRRFGWEFNGMRLHELYFSNLTKTPKHLSEDSKLLSPVKSQFGSFESFLQEFKSIGSMRGIGWVLLVYDETSNSLFNIWINEHDVGHLAGLKVLLVMDVFEHAFMVDYNLKKSDYIETFIKSIDWAVVEQRL